VIGIRAVNPRVALYPLLIAASIVFDGDIIVSSGCAIPTVASHVDISGTINRNPCCPIITIVGAIVTLDPLLLTTSVVFDSDIVFDETNTTLTDAGNIDITGAVNGESRRVIDTVICGIIISCYAPIVEVNYKDEYRTVRNI
jgi:hypothetical protein